MNVEKIVEMLQLEAHPEGGFYREVFRAKNNASTAIYFLLPVGIFSSFHRVKGSDEIWHHYLGDPVELHLIDDGGNYSCFRLGSNLENSERPQVIVPANVWQAAVPIGTEYALCGCTVAPGFEFSNFEMPRREDLTKLFPQHGSIIEQFTRT